MPNPNVARGVCPAHPEMPVNLRVNCNGRVYFLHAPCGCEHRFPVGMPVEDAPGYSSLTPRNETNERNVSDETNETNEPDVTNEPDQPEEEQADNDDDFWN